VGGPSYTWEDNIKMDLGETGFNDMDLFFLAQVGFYEHGNEHLGYTRGRVFVELKDC
jgi:hypothetical protein